MNNKPFARYQNGNRVAVLLDTRSGRGWELYEVDSDGIEMFVRYGRSGDAEEWVRG